MKNKKKIKVIWLSIISFFLLLFLFWQNNALVISNYQIASDEIGEDLDGYKIVQISDLHNKEFGKGQKRLLKKIEQCKPDLIVITGDLVDSSHTDIEIAMEFVEGVCAMAPVYYVTGNHEKWLEEGLEQELLKQLEQKGVYCLNNEKQEIKVGKNRFLLLGLDDSNLLDDTLKGLSSDTQEQFTVLLAHEPQNVLRYSNCEMDLVLSGHAHGGQIRLPFIGGVVAPDQGFFPEYTAGIYEEGNTSMIVSRGLGNSITPIRIFNQPEIVSVELKKR